MSSKAFLQRHPVAPYFVMAFLISWLGAFTVVAPKLLQGKAIPRLDGLLMFPVMLIGPSLAGIVFTSIVDGRGGLRNLFSRMGRWHVPVRWYATVLICPVLLLAVLFSLRALLSSVFTLNLNPLGIVYGLVPAFLEEVGWTGYAFPKMLVNRSALAASLLLGVLWGLWHLPVIDFLGAASPYGVYWLPFALAFIALLSAMRVLIAWNYSHTNSVLVVQLMHASLTGSLVVLGPLSVSPAQETLWYGIYATILWIVVALVIAWYGKHLVRQSIQLKTMETATE